MKIQRPGFQDSDENTTTDHDSDDTPPFPLVRQDAIASVYFF